MLSRSNLCMTGVMGFLPYRPHPALREGLCPRRNTVEELRLKNKAEWKITVVVYL